MDFVQFFIIGLVFTVSISMVGIIQGIRNDLSYLSSVNTTLLSTIMYVLVKLVYYLMSPVFVLLFPIYFPRGELISSHGDLIWHTHTYTNDSLRIFSGFVVAFIAVFILCIVKYRWFKPKDQDEFKNLITIELLYLPFLLFVALCVVFLIGLE